jgi:hypothetical protein
LLIREWLEGSKTKEGNTEVAMCYFFNITKGRAIGGLVMAVIESNR